MCRIREPDGSFSAYKDNKNNYNAKLFQSPATERADRTEHIAVYWPSAENRCKSTQFLSDLYLNLTQPSLILVYIPISSNIFK